MIQIQPNGERDPHFKSVTAFLESRRNEERLSFETINVSSLL